VIALAGAERGDHAHTGHDDGRLTPGGAVECHGFSLLSRLRAGARDREELANRLDESHALAAPMPDAGNDDLRQGVLHRALDTRLIAGRKQTALAERECRKRDIHRELRLRPMSKMATGRTHRDVRM